MMRKTLLLFALAMLFAVFGASASAQTSTVPDALVKGTGTISVVPPGPLTIVNTGMFDINVARYGTALTGGFRYTESTGHAGEVVNRIYSQVITGMVVTGNTAVIRANGYWNGMFARLTVTVLDDTAGDNFRIVAEELMVTTEVRPPLKYDQGGGLTSGDIRVFSQPPAPEAAAKGDGMIKATNSTVGRFTFSVQKTNGVVKGSLKYTEYNPMIMSAIIRPKASIYLPAVEKFVLNGLTATFSGKGTLNGKPAYIEVTAVDSPTYPVARPDTFTIKATPLASDAVSNLYYFAGGPLVYGDIVVHPRPIIL